MALLKRLIIIWGMLLWALPCGATTFCCHDDGDNDSSGVYDGDWDQAMAGLGALLAAKSFSTDTTLVGEMANAIFQPGGDDTGANVIWDTLGYENIGSWSLGNPDTSKLFGATWNRADAANVCFDFASGSVAATWTFRAIHFACTSAVFINFDGARDGTIVNLQHCWVDYNSSDVTNYGIFCDRAGDGGDTLQLNLTNCLITTGALGDGDAWGLFDIPANVTLTLDHCTIVGNFGNSYYGIFHLCNYTGSCGDDLESTITVKNCVIKNTNTTSQWFFRNDDNTLGLGTLVMDYNCWSGLGSGFSNEYKPTALNGYASFTSWQSYMESNWSGSEAHSFRNPPDINTNSTYYIPEEGGDLHEAGEGGSDIGWFQLGESNPYTLKKRHILKFY